MDLDSQMNIAVIPEAIPYKKIHTLHYFPRHARAYGLSPFENRRLIPVHVVVW